MKYLAINPDQIECTKCTSRFKAEASFCGFCGAPAVRRTIALNAILEKEPQRKTPVEMDAIRADAGAAFIFEDDDFDDFEKPKNNILAVAVITTSVIAVGIMSFILFIQATDTKNVERETVAIAAPIVKNPVLKEKPVKKIRFVLTENKRSRELSAKGLLITINQTKDSRYKTIDKRAQSILIRLNYAMEKIQKGECESHCFTAVKNGKHSEVRFMNKEGAPFRLLDVTKRDARREKTTPHIRANLIVDQLNALLETKSQPLAFNSRN